MPDAIMVWDGTKIRAKRKKLRLTQADVAKALGCRMQTVSEWETGLYEPKNAYQRLLGMYFDMVEQERKK
jgi:DNA-binding transcriptional regulator YiaG